MGKVKEPKVLVLDTCYMQDSSATLVVLDLVAKGHVVIWFDDPKLVEWLPQAHMIISPKAQMTPLSRLGYVVKKLKEICKELV